MKPEACPHLGLKSDSTTSMDFPSEGNYCHHSKPIAPVKRDHQKTHCLTKNHTVCPVFFETSRKKLPADIISPQYRRDQIKRLLFRGGLFIAIIAIGFVLTTLWRSYSGLANDLFAQELNTINNPDSLAPSTSRTQPSSGESLEITPTDIQLILFTSTPISVNASCTLPEGWILYTVKPTDSLYGVSLVYKISIDNLRSANCLSEGSIIRPGQGIYVPSFPTSTPTATRTPTSTPTIEYKPTKKPTKEEKPEKDPKPTTQPTSAPPTDRPPDEEPTSEPTSQPPPTDPPPSKPTPTSAPPVEPTSAP